MPDGSRLWNIRCRGFAASSGVVSHQYAKGSELPSRPKLKWSRSRTAQPGAIVEMWAFSAEHTCHSYFIPRQVLTGLQNWAKLGYFPCSSSIWCGDFWVFRLPKSQSVHRRMQLLFCRNIVQWHNPFLRRWAFVLTNKTWRAHALICALPEPKCLQSFLPGLLHGERGSRPVNKEGRNIIWIGF